jgi:hypothetical protein
VQFAEWETQLKKAGEETHLPAETNALPALNDLLVRLRMASIR